MRNLLLLLCVLFSTTNYSQQIDGVFTEFAKSNEWGNTVINTATQEVLGGYITLAGYYHGAAPAKKFLCYFK